LTRALAALFIKQLFYKIGRPSAFVKGFLKMTGLQNQEATKRGRGRPPVRSEEETRHLLVEAAAQEFQQSGFAAAAMGAISQRAGFSTRTIYQLVSTKAELFEMVVSDRIGRFMLAVDEGSLDALEPIEALEHILVAYGNLTLSAETTALTRLVIAEGERFPEIATAFYTRAIERVNGVIEGWLLRQTECGRLTLSDPHAAAGMLRGMMIMEPQRAVFLGKGGVPSSDEIAERGRICAQLFLRGCQSQAI
jgi:AcrR family transcriptional regulator